MEFSEEDVKRSRELYRESKQMALRLIRTTKGPREAVAELLPPFIRAMEVEGVIANGRVNQFRCSVTMLIAVFTHMLILGGFLKTDFFAEENIPEEEDEQHP